MFVDANWPFGLQLMDNNLIVPGGAIVADNTLMKAPPSFLCSTLFSTYFVQTQAHRLLCSLPRHLLPA